MKKERSWAFLWEATLALLLAGYPFLAEGFEGAPATTDPKPTHPAQTYSESRHVAQIGPPVINGELASENERTSADDQRPAETIDETTVKRTQGSATPYDQALVRKIQRLLRQHSFDAGPVDGIIGPTTKKAIEAFQTSIGVPADGRPSQGLVELLQELGASEPKPGGLAGAKSKPEARQQAAVDVTAGTVLRSQPLSQLSLTGTTWRFIDETGSSIVLEFAPNGVVKGVLYESFWSWLQNSKEVVILYNNGMGLTVSRTGRLSSDFQMSGQADPSRGEGWLWSAERISPPPSALPPSPAEYGSEQKPEPKIREAEPDLSRRHADTLAIDSVSATPEVSDEQATMPSSEEMSLEPQSPQTNVEPSVQDETPPPLAEIPQVPPETPTVAVSPPPVEESPTETLGDVQETSGPPRTYGESESDSRIVILAADDSWLEVTDADGKIIFSRVLRKGDSYRVPALRGARFVTGNAGGLEILVDGELAPALGPSAKVRRDVQLDPDLLKAGAAWSPQSAQ
jgi:peptidoglycan hydrolase-like protein with peptidoglycan-binding domain